MYTTAKVIAEVHNPGPGIMQGIVVTMYLVHNEAYRETVTDIHLAVLGWNTEADYAYLDVLVLRARQQVGELMQVLSTPSSRLLCDQNTVSYVSYTFLRDGF